MLGVKIWFEVIVWNTTEDNPTDTAVTAIAARIFILRAML